MAGSRFCTACGQLVAGAFCTSCGNRAAAPAAPDPPKVAASPPPRPRTALRCIECGSDIQHGLVCARCAAMRAPTPPSAAPTALPSSAAARYKKPAPPEEKGKWVPWVAWPLALLIGLAYYGAKAGMRLPSLPSGADGVYLYEAQRDQGGSWIRMEVKGGRATLTTSAGDREAYKVERSGETLRFVDEEVAEDGYLKPGAGVGRVGLAKIVDDGQALRITEEGLDVRLVKQ